MKTAEEKVVCGYLHSIETMGLVDGPGIRTVFFMQGCPLRCRYCHNPDTQKTGAGRKITPQEVLRYARRYRPYQGQDGGVTFSGGEPLLQGAFLAEALALLKKNGFSTCIDSSGFGQKQYYSRIFPLVDTLLLDIKAFSDEAHKEMCGAPLSPVAEFMNNLRDYGFSGQIWIRHVMLPGFTDSEEAMQKLVKTLKPIQYSIERLEILPYHTAGTAKYRELGIPYTLENVAPMDKNRAKEFERYANRLLAKQMSASRGKIRQNSDQPHPLNGGKYMTKPKDPITGSENEILKKISEHPLFRHLHPKIFSDIKEDLLILNLKKDQILFSSGDNPDYMYLICEGAVKIYTSLPDNEEQILYIYQGGDFVGGHNLLEKSPYRYTCEAVSDTVIAAIPGIVFEAYFSEQNSVLKVILSQSFERIRWAEDLINRMATLNSSVKAVSLILRLAEQAKGKSDYSAENPDNGVISIPLPLNREEMSNFSGMSRESLSRKLGEFEELGYIEIKSDELTILNYKALESYLD